MKTLSLLGSTGSIGTHTLEVVSQFPEQFRVICLAAGENIALLRKQITAFNPSVVSVKRETDVLILSKQYPNIQFYSGQSGLEHCASLSEVDIVIMGVLGFAALSPTLAAIRANKRIALANKEVLVTGGELLKKEAAESRCEIIPVDSEHNALFQLLEGRDRSEVESLVLTASGGPFLNQPKLDLSTVTPEMATAHPNWKMGPKISVDCATLFNKGLELIEAYFLFDTPADQIEVWIHPQSIIHGAIWLKDNSCLCQLNKPNMKASIGHALGYPKRLRQVAPKISLTEMARLEFMSPDETRFRGIQLCRQALQAGQSHVIALNAANELAVEAFLKGKIRFTQIEKILDFILESHSPIPVNDLPSIFRIDELARATTKNFLEG